MFRSSESDHVRLRLVEYFEELLLVAEDAQHILVQLNVGWFEIVQLCLKLAESAEVGIQEISEPEALEMVGAQRVVVGVAGPEGRRTRDEAGFAVQVREFDEGRLQLHFLERSLISSEIGHF